MAQENPHIQEVSYQHPHSYDYSAARLVRYLSRRPLDRGNPGPESQWATVPEERTFGDAEAFKAAANARTKEIREDAQRRGKDLSKNKARWCVSYLHVVLSPANRAELSDEDFGELLRPWVSDGGGGEVPYFAAIHREEPGREHLHVALARGKFEADELRSLKDRTDALAMSFEREIEQTPERDNEQSMERTMERTTEREELAHGLEL